MNDAAITTISKDYFVRGLHPELQKELRKDAGYEDKSMTQLAKSVTYLEIAGVNSGASQTEVVGSVKAEGDKTRVDVLEAKIDELLNTLGRPTIARSEEVEEEDKINYAGSQNVNHAPNKRRSNRGRAQSRGGQRNSGKTLECRICNSTEHLFRQCPSRFCQSCGNKGHDGWDRACPLYK